jgi:hypothetical protein
MEEAMTRDWSIKATEPMTKEELLKLAQLGDVTIVRFDRDLEQVVTDTITADMPESEICL